MTTNKPKGKKTVRAWAHVGLTNGAIYEVSLEKEHISCLLGRTDCIVPVEIIYEV